MSETRELIAEVRELNNKSAVKTLRKSGFTPAIFYGKGAKNINLKLNEKETRKILHTEAGLNVIINLIVKEAKGEKKFTVIPQDVQFNPLTDLIDHIDLRQINLKEKITTTVEVKIVGIAPGIKKGGILVQNLHRVEIKCLPTDIPAHIDIDISGLEEINASIKVGDVKFPTNIEVLNLHAEQTAVAILAPKIEAVPEAAAAAGPEIAEPELVAQKGSEEKAEAKEEKNTEKKE